MSTGQRRLTIDAGAIIINIISIENQKAYCLFLASRQIGIWRAADFPVIASQFSNWRGNLLVRRTTSRGKIPESGTKRAVCMTIGCPKLDGDSHESSALLSRNDNVVRCPVFPRQILNLLKNTDKHVHNTTLFSLRQPTGAVSVSTRRRILPPALFFSNPDRNLFC